MKKHILALFMLCSFANASAQFLMKGSHLISGSFSYSAYTEKYKFNGNTTTILKNSEIGFLPNYGYLVIDNLSVGAGLNYTSEKTTYEEDYEGEEIQTLFTFGPIVRYYIVNGFFGQGYYGFGSAKEEYSEFGDTEEYKYSVTEWRIGLGYSIKLSETVLLDPMLSYGSASYKDKDSDEKYISDAHFMVQVGFTVFFPN